ncbi:MAG: sugar transporter permease [Cellulosimicrobium sp.]|jgi:multiple sugar transport system permease protein|uniref:Sugar ABC transporter permease n=3 Tax=Cellulosimicrobium TaxID=157920 RepID=A0A0H2KS72_9MICO|nr:MULTISPECIES: sugar ABC transporter permease [Cellulosimicrobium]MDF2807832.1 sugar transporter permease [Cellulosimicrobium sp.]ARU51345.1 sugar ABC transporter permease [Cellulosimicrobium cellulans]KLN36405.1 sugar ABC transporter permease [Cellulosimicrobium funkei]KZM79794.1 sugar ABC transporter permease [Cellulosimicrobium sp. I38E]MBM7817761.1 multiple sugar transport system permease protein [Cellulosimicrobium cellulans]
MTTTTEGRRRRTAGAVHRRRQALVAWLFALPFVAVFAVFMLGPLLASFGMSFSDLTIRDIKTPFAVNFVGLENFTGVFQDELFRKALLNTFYFVLVGIPLTMVLGLALAVALNSGIEKFRSVFRVGFYTPVVTSIVAVAVVWRFILQDSGLVNTVLGWVGIDGPDWLNDSATAMPSIIVMAAWRNMGTLMIIFLAGLQAIPRDVYEAAEVDGAGSWRRFRSITVPLMRPTLLLGAVLLSVGFLQVFEEPFVMTKGGPVNSTLTISYYVYNQFGYGNYAFASAAAYVLFALIAALAAVQFRLLRSKED